MPRGRKPKGTTQEWYIAVCGTCVIRRIKKKSLEELLRVAKKNKWRIKNHVLSKSFTCPECIRKEEDDL